MNLDGTSEEDTQNEKYWLESPRDASSRSSWLANSHVKSPKDINSVLPDDGVSIEEVGGMQELITQLKEQIIIPLNAKAANLHIPSKYYASPKGWILLSECV